METFPDEIVEAILVYTWADSSFLKSRWSVYRKVLGLSRQWNRIIRGVVLQYRFLETLTDFQAYSHLHLPCLEHSNSQYRYLRISYNDTSISCLHLFGLEPYLHNCVELDIPPKCGANLWRLFHNLAEKESPLRIVSVAFSDLASHYYNKCEWPSATLPSVTALNITNGTPIAWSWDVMDFQALLASFPKLVHLSMDAIVNLRSILESLQTLETLTLVIPGPVDESPGSSLTAWKLLDVLEDRAFHPDQVVIESGPVKPSGYDDLREICDALDVRLVHDVNSGGAQPTIKETSKNEVSSWHLENTSFSASNRVIAGRFPLPFSFLQTASFLVVFRKRGLDKESYKREVGQSKMILNAAEWSRWCLGTWSSFGEHLSSSSPFQFSKS